MAIHISLLSRLSIDQSSISYMWVNFGSIHLCIDINLKKTWMSSSQCIYNQKVCLLSFLKYKANSLLFRRVAGWLEIDANIVIGCITTITIIGIVVALVLVIVMKFLMVAQTR